MTYVKRLVMQGFKSFVRKTELPFTPGINVILGPNGSGKSNVSDALCFVLGRLSIKSMRAAKAKNLIFLGSKVASPAKEAMVEIVFDNSEGTFTDEKKEIAIRRIVRRNGQSIYKINGETKTRQQVIGLLAQAGIDPNGFNIILQGEIQNFVKMHTEERRKVIEEVAGISIYEMRKEKSLKELDRTESKLKEVMTTLRERTAYLNNLEKERQQALRFKKLEKDAKIFKASIISQDLNVKRKEKERVDGEIIKINKEIDKLKKVVLDLKSSISQNETKINSINETMQKSAGFEQEKLNREIADLRAELEGLKVKLENNIRKVSEITVQKEEFEKTIAELEISIKELRRESPTLDNKRKEVERKKRELEKLEEQRKKFYMIKSDLKAIGERVQDKKYLLQSFTNESDYLVKQIESLSIELFDKRSDREKLEKLKFLLKEKTDLIEALGKREIDLEKVAHTNEYEIDKQNKLIDNIAKIDVCPLCKNKVTAEHIKGIKNEVSPKINMLQKEMDKSDKELNEIYEKRKMLGIDISQMRDEVSKRESDLIKMMNINTKRDQVKTLREKITELREELAGLEKKKKNMELNFDENSGIEQKYATASVEIEEISLRSKENVSSEISFKQREYERARIALKQLERNQKDLDEDISELEKTIAKKTVILDGKKKNDEELSKRFNNLIKERDEYQAKIKELDSTLFVRQNDVYNNDQKINNFKIDLAKVGAEIENLEVEMLEFGNVEVIKGNRDNLAERLARTLEVLSRIRSNVNLRSLEVYDEIKQEYDTIKEKVEMISKEKASVMRIIHEIDIKKKRTFLKTLNELNEIFSNNFSQLSFKGQVTLELENKKEPFEGGVGIIVKMGHGKYFDVTSLSGGEQTLVALSLIFGIQELKPYAFYILDEIDAALDKRNSERLAGLLKKYMKKGQYLVITHNDEIISNATNLYGISMFEGVSKALSLKL
jgi:chromosome segregation protein